jgi:hypothetical protein
MKRFALLGSLCVLALAGGGCAGSGGGAGDTPSNDSSSGGRRADSGSGGATASGGVPGVAGGGGAAGGTSGAAGARDADLEAVPPSEDAGATGGSPVVDDGGAAMPSDGAGGSASGAPLLPILEAFTAPDVPATGPKEGPAPARPWPLPTVMPMLPGTGLAQHPMLYAGEGYNAVLLVNHGKVVWSYAMAGPGEIDDVWMMSNGHVLVCFEHSVVELTPTKQIAWSYAVPGEAQVHSCQPVGLERVLMMQNDLPPKVILFNKSTNMVEQSRPLPTPGGVNPGAIHTQFRRFRQTGAGTYLAAWLDLNQVVEYDKDLKIIWSYAITNPWSAIRLKNGNTLITSESQRLVREVDPKSATVWEWKQSTDLPAGILQQNTQTAERLDNGNTIIFASRSPRSATQPNVQAIEVTRDKKVVWVLQDWKNLGQATTAQFLDQPGLPEVPGDLVH